MKSLTQDQINNLMLVINSLRTRKLGFIDGLISKKELKAKIRKLGVKCFGMQIIEDKTLKSNEFKLK